VSAKPSASVFFSALLLQQTRKMPSESRNTPQRTLSSEIRRLLRRRRRGRSSGDAVVEVVSRERAAKPSGG
jgi:hypothetical protein